jgi:hypothetical protein
MIKSHSHGHHWEFSKISTIELDDDVHYREVHLQQKIIAWTCKNVHYTEVSIIETCPVCRGSIPAKNVSSDQEESLLIYCSDWILLQIRLKELRIAFMYVCIFHRS